MAFTHQRKVFLLFDKGQVTITDVFDGLACDTEGDIFGYPIDDLIFLSNVVDDGDFYFLSV